ncbi:hypothetical protein ACFLYY_00305 [Patescibacteria group bacterium]
MKKFLPTLVLLSLLGVIFIPAMASAQATQCTVRHAFTIGSGEGTSITNCTPGVCIFDSVDGADCSQCCLLDTIYTITDWIFFFVMALAVIFILMGALTFITAGGDPEKPMKARQYLIFAAVGIIVALIAKAVPAIMKSVIGLS